MKIYLYYIIALFTLLLSQISLTKKSSNINHLQYNSIKTNSDIKEEINNQSNDSTTKNIIFMSYYNIESNLTQILGKRFSFPSTVSNLEVYVNNKLEYNYKSCNNTKINENNTIPLYQNFNVTIKFDGYLTSMYDMYSFCNSLIFANLSNCNTSQVNDMGRMFIYCNTLANLDISNFDTKIVTNMGGMFSSCTS